MDFGLDWCRYTVGARPLRITTLIDYSSHTIAPHHTDPPPRCRTPPPLPGTHTFPLPTHTRFAHRLLFPFPTVEFPHLPRLPFYLNWSPSLLPHLFSYVGHFTLRLDYTLRTLHLDPFIWITHTFYLLLPGCCYLLIVITLLRWIRCRWFTPHAPLLLPVAGYITLYRLRYAFTLFVAHATGCYPTRLLRLPHAHTHCTHTPHLYRVYGCRGSPTHTRWLVGSSLDPHLPLLPHTTPHTTYTCSFSSHTVYSHTRITFVTRYWVYRMDTVPLGPTHPLYWLVTVPCMRFSSLPHAPSITVWFPMPRFFAATRRYYTFHYATVYHAGFAHAHAARLYAARAPPPRAMPLRMPGTRILLLRFTPHPYPFARLPARVHLPLPARVPSLLTFAY